MEVGLGGWSDARRGDELRASAGRAQRRGAGSGRAAGCGCERGGRAGREEAAVGRRTRALLLSNATNPWFFSGSAGEGVGGPHSYGADWIWPMSLIMRALTSSDDSEIAAQLRMLKAAAAGTGLMHESFYRDDASQFTRKWFAWANSLFGELILTLAEERPHLLPPSRGPLAVVHVLPACRHRELLLQAVLRHRHTCALA